MTLADIHFIESFYNFKFIELPLKISFTESSIYSIKISQKRSQMNFSPNRWEIEKFFIVLHCSEDCFKKYFMQRELFERSQQLILYIA